MTTREISELPSVVLLDRVHLLLHRDTPCRVSLCLSEEAMLTVLVCQVQLCLEVVYR